MHRVRPNKQGRLKEEPKNYTDTHTAVPTEEKENKHENLWDILLRILRLRSSHADGAFSTRLSLRLARPRSATNCSFTPFQKVPPAPVCFFLVSHTHPSLCWSNKCCFLLKPQLRFLIIASPVSRKLIWSLLAFHMLFIVHFRNEFPPYPTLKFIILLPKFYFVVFCVIFPWSLSLSGVS